MSVIDQLMIKAKKFITYILILFFITQTVLSFLRYVRFENFFKKSTYVMILFPTKYDNFSNKWFSHIKDGEKK